MSRIVHQKLTEGNESTLIVFECLFFIFLFQLLCQSEAVITFPHSGIGGGGVFDGFFVLFVFGIALFEQIFVLVVCLQCFFVFAEVVVCLSDIGNRHEEAGIQPAPLDLFHVREGFVDNVLPVIVVPDRKDIEFLRREAGASLEDQFHTGGLQGFDFFQRAEFLCGFFLHADDFCNVLVHIVIVRAVYFCCGSITAHDGFAVIVPVILTLIFQTVQRFLFCGIGCGGFPFCIVFIFQCFQPFAEGCFHIFDTGKTVTGLSQFHFPFGAFGIAFFQTGEDGEQFLCFRRSALILICSEQPCQSHFVLVLEAVLHGIFLDSNEHGQTFCEFALADIEDPDSCLSIKVSR